MMDGGGRRRRSDGPTDGWVTQGESPTEGHGCCCVCCCLWGPLGAVSTAFLGVFNPFCGTVFSVKKMTSPDHFGDAGFGD